MERLWGRGWMKRMKGTEKKGTGRRRERGEEGNGERREREERNEREKKGTGRKK
jgi:hypothetical protein